MEVTTELNGSSVDVTVLGDARFGIFGDSGANRAFAFNLAGPHSGVSVTDVTDGFSYAGAGLNVGGPFGVFEFVLNGPHAARDAALPLSFTLSRLGGFSSSDIFEANARGFFFTAHLRDDNGAVGGWIAGGTPTAELSKAVIVNAEPASLVLLGSGGLLLARLLRRRRAAPRV